MLISFPEMFRRHRIKSKGALHLGANLGQEAQTYRSLGIQRVVWVEALPKVYEQLRRNVARFPDSIALLACISDKDGAIVDFNEASNEGQSSSLLEFGTHAKAHPDTTFIARHKMITQRVDTLFKEQGLEAWLPTGSFLNIDLQGAELMALRGLGEVLTRFDYAYVEVNEEELYTGCPLVGDINAFMFEKGFVGLESKMTKWKWGDRLYGRR